MKVTSKGQITIPQEYREQYGLLPHTEVDFIPDVRGLKLVKSKTKRLRGDRLIEHMRGRGDGKLTTEQIMRLTRGEG